MLYPADHSTGRLPSTIIGSDLGKSISGGPPRVEICRHRKNYEKPLKFFRRPADGQSGRSRSSSGSTTITWSGGRIRIGLEDRPSRSPRLRIGGPRGCRGSHTGMKGPVIVRCRSNTVTQRRRVAKTVPTRGMSELGASHDGQPRIQTPCTAVRPRLPSCIGAGIGAAVRKPGPRRGGSARCRRPG
jgi:hypothetical protein